MGAGAVQVPLGLVLIFPPIHEAPRHRHGRPVLFPGGRGVAVEDRTGQRTSFRHWNAGDLPDDGCNTRAEVLLAEAVDYPLIGPGCTLTGASWVGWYDEISVTAAGGPDIDHMVPLGEPWDSGASARTAKRREAYANDRGAPASLVAVTAAST